MNAPALSDANAALLARSTTALRAGDLVAACALARAVLSTQPDAAGALAVLALALGASGDAAAAIAMWERLIALMPTVPAYHANLGSALRDLGHRDAAADAYARALVLRPGEPSLLYNRALLHLDLGELGDARRLLAAALDGAPGDVEIRVQLVRTLVELGAERDAREILRDVDDHAVTAVVSLLALAGSCTQLGLDARADSLLARALTLAPNEAAVHAQLAMNAERHNRLDEAARHLDHARALGAAMHQTSTTPAPKPTAHSASESIDLLAAHGRLAMRRGDAAAARVDYAAAIDASPSESTRVPHLFDLAKACDRLGDTDAAFAALTRAHAARAAQFRRDDPAAAAAEPELLTVLRDSLTSQDVARWPALSSHDPSPAPIFVVGFPRSGTTLLEQMLDAHPSLRSMDERPYLQYAISRALRSGIDYPQALDTLDATQATALRDYYRRCVAEVVQLRDGETLVDKNPLNIARLPMIARLWPDARVIVALRDPRDVVWSCFMQNFRNPGIARLCESLTRTAQTYAAVFEWFERHAPLLPLRILRSRYEDLVAEPELRTRELCAFLGLAEDAAMAAPGEHARQRGYIATPSYAQVVEPVHTRAIGRWQRYRAHFNEAEAILAPWLARYGYSP